MDAERRTVSLVTVNQNLCIFEVLLRTVSIITRGDFHRIFQRIWFYHAATMLLVELSNKVFGRLCSVKYSSGLLHFHSCTF